LSNRKVLKVRGRRQGTAAIREQLLAAIDAQQTDDDPVETATTTAPRWRPLPPLDLLPTTRPSRLNRKQRRDKARAERKRHK
jgi:hypothetical protein